MGLNSGHRTIKTQWLRLACMLFIISLGNKLWASEQVEVPEVNASVGSCAVTFTVTDREKKPIFNAKIDVSVRWGPMGVRKVELTVGTNTEGQARVIGLPEKGKKPLEFRVSVGEWSRTVPINPAEKCKSTADVVLGDR